MTRRDLYRYLSIGLGNMMGLVLAVPGVSYLLDPILRRGAGVAGHGFAPLARLSDLTVGIPRAFPVILERQDAWVKYDREPVGLVWLIRHNEGNTTPVESFTAECPHLGCAVNLDASGKAFLCPCHNSSFNLEGKPLNATPPRGMDRLEIKFSSDPDPGILVKFERFRTMSKEKIPLG